MKKSVLALLFFCFLVATVLKAQDTVRVKVLGKNLVTVVEDKDHSSDVSIGNNAVSIKEGNGDTVKVRVGHRAVIISDGRHNSELRFKHLDDQEFETWTGHPAKFEGHWAGLELGINSFTNANYQGFTPNFMDLNQNKSFEVGINFLQYSFGLQKEKKSIGIVTGLGLTYNDYRFSNPWTIENNGGEVKSVPLNSNGLSKTKLSTSYLTIPLLLEFQIPVHGTDKRIYLSGGFVGGLKMGSHTKVKTNGDKSKSRDDFNINPFRCGATTRVGYRGINLFGTYYFSTFYKTNRGPELFPFTIGITLMNW
jgi:hypothetical protein